MLVHTTPLCWPGAISSVFHPPPFSESGFEVTAPRFEREREKEHLLWRFLRIGRFIPVRLFAGTEGGKMDWSSERRESARQRDQCLSATQRARKK